MVKTSLFKPIHVECDGHLFDSAFEREVYLALKRDFGKKNVSLQVPVLVEKPQQGKPARFWKIDFRVCSSRTGRIFWVEAKGYPDTQLQQRINKAAVLNEGLEFNLMVLHCNDAEFSLVSCGLGSHNFYRDYESRRLHHSSRFKHIFGE